MGLMGKKYYMPGASMFLTVFPEFRGLGIATKLQTVMFKDPIHQTEPYIGMEINPKTINDQGETIANFKPAVGYLRAMEKSQFTHIALIKDDESSAGCQLTVKRAINLFSENPNLIVTYGTFWRSYTDQMWASKGNEAQKWPQCDAAPRTI